MWVDCSINLPWTVCHLISWQEPGCPSTPHDLAVHINEPHFPTLLHDFLIKQLHPEWHSDNPKQPCPEVYSNIHVFYSAITTFSSPSDPSGIGRMWQEWICATLSSHQDTPGPHAGWNMQHAHFKVQAFLFFQLHWQNLSLWYNQLVCNTGWYTRWYDLNMDHRTRVWRYRGKVHCNNPSWCVLHAAHVIGLYAEKLTPVKLKAFRLVWYFDAFMSTSL